MCLLQTAACLVQVHFSLFAVFGNSIHAFLIQVDRLTQVINRTNLTVHKMHKKFTLPIMGYAIILQYTIYNFMELPEQSSKSLPID